MPHEFRYLANACHESRTPVLWGGLANAVIVVAFALFLKCRRRRRSSRDGPRGAETEGGTKANAPASAFAGTRFISGGHPCRSNA